MLDDFIESYRRRFPPDAEYEKRRYGRYFSFLEPLLRSCEEKRVLLMGEAPAIWCDMLDASSIEYERFEEKGTLQSSAYMAVTIFGMAGGVDRQKLLKLFAAAKEALCDTGLLIVDAPNPENIRLSTDYIYREPLDMRPVPMQLLGFMLEYSGFPQVSFVRVDENESLSFQRYGDILHVLDGVSRRYAAVAMKNGSSVTVENFDTLAGEYGTTFEDFVSKFEYRLLSFDKHIDDMRERFEKISDYAQMLESATKEYETLRRDIDAAWRERMDMAKSLESLGEGLKMAESRMESLKRDGSYIRGELKILAMHIDELEKESAHLRDFVYGLSSSHHGLSQTVHGLSQAVHALTLNMEEMGRVSSGCTILKRCIKRILRMPFVLAGRLGGSDVGGSGSAAVEREEPVQEREESLQEEERVEILPSQELRRVPGGLCISSKEERR